MAWHTFIEYIPLIALEGTNEFWWNYDGVPMCGIGNTIEESIINLKKLIEEKKSPWG